MWDVEQCGRNFQISNKFRHQSQRRKSPAQPPWDFTGVHYFAKRAGYFIPPRYIWYLVFVFDIWNYVHGICDGVFGLVCHVFQWCAFFAGLRWRACNLMQPKQVLVQKKIIQRRQCSCKSSGYFGLKNIIHLFSCILSVHCSDDYMHTSRYMSKYIS